jgi:hypothetical protein
LGERLLCKQEVIGSIPFTSTTSLRLVVRRDNGNSCYRESGSEQKRAPGFREIIETSTIVEVQVCRRLRTVAGSLTG